MDGRAPIEANGLFHKETEQAIKEFQTAKTKLLDRMISYNGHPERIANLTNLVGAANFDNLPTEIQNRMLAALEKQPDNQRLYNEGWSVSNTDDFVSDSAKKNFS